MLGLFAVDHIHATCRRIRTCRDPDGAVLDQAGLDAAEAALEILLAPSDHTRIKHMIGVKGVAPDGRLLAYPEARAAWMQHEHGTP